MAGRRCVLIVDDSVDATEVLAMLIEGMGHETCVAHDGASALRLAGEKRPDVMLLDLSLPDMSGYEVAKKLRADASFAPMCLVGLSGFGAAQHRPRCLEVGIEHYFEKPIDIVALEVLLDQLAQRSA